MNTLSCIKIDGSLTLHDKHLQSSCRQPSIQKELPVICFKSLAFINLEILQVDELASDFYTNFKKDS